jgi:opacity protein-like surface antigen
VGRAALTQSKPARRSRPRLALTPAIIVPLAAEHFHAKEEAAWFVPFYVGVGTGESKFTWQANAGVGYRFDRGVLVASWRYLDYDLKSGGHVDSLSFSGPLIGVGFKF